MSFNKLNSKGFTIIELLIASVAFSFIIILITVLVIQVSKVYYKGIIVSNTQNAARNIILDVEKSIQFSSHLSSSFTSFNYNIPNTGSWINWYCIGDQLFAYQTISEFNTSSSLSSGPYGYNIGFVYNLASICPSNFQDLKQYINGTNNYDHNNSFQELLGNGMSVRYFKIIPPSGNQNTWQILLSVQYGNLNYALQNPNIKSQYNCVTQIGDQYCATANLTAEVSPIGE